MQTQSLPPHEVMLEAFLSRDVGYEGIFFTAVRTTGIFCHPTCSAKNPRIENMEFFATVGEALFAGYRPCKICRPLEPPGSPPDWLHDLLEELQNQPSHRWTDADLKKRGLSPGRVRRWFQRHYGMTFQAYSRAKRLGLALRKITGGDSVIKAAYNQGYESLSGFNTAFRQALGRSPSEARGTQQVSVTRLVTPLGPMLAAATEEALCLLEFAERSVLETQLKGLTKRLGWTIAPGMNPVIEQLSQELAAYFAGTLKQFTVPLLTPGSEFQQMVWGALRRVPFGEQTTYGALATQIGRPSAVRAVAGAIGDNRIAIVIPCHRVVGSDGRLTGYGGGLWRKRRLLDLEGAQLGL